MILVHHVSIWHFFLIYLDSEFSQRACFLQKMWMHEVLQTNLCWYKISFVIFFELSKNCNKMINVIVLKMHNLVWCFAWIKLAQKSYHLVASSWVMLYILTSSNTIISDERKFCHIKFWRKIQKQTFLDIWNLCTSFSVMKHCK